MTVLSSHLLNGATGQHGANLTVEIYQLDGIDPGHRKHIAKTVTDEQGRFKVDLTSFMDSNNASFRFEMVVSTEGMFNSGSDKMPDNPMNEIVIRFNIYPDQDIQHIPIIISPNSYSVWWSNPE